MADYMYVNDLNNSEYLTTEQERRFEAAKQKATAEGHEFLSPEWKRAWADHFGEL
jgi:hypothetical protein